MGLPRSKAWSDQGKKWREQSHVAQLEERPAVPVCRGFKSRRVTRPGQGHKLPSPRTEAMYRSPFRGSTTVVRLPVKQDD